MHSLKKDQKQLCKLKILQEKGSLFIGSIIFSIKNYHLIP